ADIYDLQFRFLGAPGAGAVDMHLAARAVTIGNADPGEVHVGVNPTDGTATLDVQVNGVSVGGIEITTSGVVTWNLAAPVVSAAGWRWSRRRRRTRHSRRCWSRAGAPAPDRPARHPHGSPLALEALEGVVHLRSVHAERLGQLDGGSWRGVEGGGQAVPERPGTVSSRRHQRWRGRGARLGDQPPLGARSELPPVARAAGEADAAEERQGGRDAGPLEAGLGRDLDGAERPMVPQGHQHRAIG